MLGHVKPIDRFWIRGGPGFEYRPHENDEENTEVSVESDSSDDEEKTKFMLRTIIGNEFSFGRVVITPTAGADYLRSAGTIIVLGFNIGFGF